ncbi:MAG: hypothetical protein WDN00_15725 [Limisphaerales bacterium]
MEKISIGPVHGRISRGILAHLGLVAILAVTGLAGGCDKGKTPVAQVGGRPKHKPNFHRSSSSFSTVPRRLFPKQQRLPKLRQNQI